MTQGAKMPEVTDTTVSLCLTSEERQALDKYLFNTGMSKKGLIRQLVLKTLKEAGLLPESEKD